MRNAKANDYWRRIDSKSFNSYIKSIRFSNHPLLDGLSLEFSPGLSVVCGGNGVGKSQIATILSYLTNSELTAEYISKLPAVADAAVTYIENDTENSIILDYSSGVPKIPPRPTIAKFINPSEYGLLIRGIFSKEDDLQDYLDQFEAISLQNKELKSVNQILRKSYSAIEIITTDRIERDLPVPYFRLKTESATYGTESMGMGELCALLLFWIYKIMDNGTSLILEEPENFLMHGAQDDIANYIAKQASERSINTILISHSPAILNKVKADRINLIYTEEGKAKVIKLPTLANLADYTGYQPIPKKFIYLEDSVAKLVLSEALSQISPKSLLSVKLCIAGDNSKLDLIASASNLIDFADISVVYDGDCSQDVKRQSNGSFLYGSKSPESEIMRSVKSRISQCARKLKVSNETLGMALNSSSGVDDHEAIRKVANILGIEYDHCLKAFIAQHIEKEKAFYKRLINNLVNLQPVKHPST